MLFDAQAKDCTHFFSLHIELIMWGDDFLEINAENPEEPIVKWLSLCDGGSIENEGSKSISKETFDRIIDYIYSVDFPDHEDDEMNLQWEINYIVSLIEKLTADEKEKLLKMLC